MHSEHCTRRDFLKVLGAGAAAMTLPATAARARAQQSTSTSAPAATADGIPAGIIREHVERLAALLREHNLAGVVLFHWANMFAFTGTRHSSSDRLTLGMVTRDGQVFVICPAFERPGVQPPEGLATVYGWEDDADPYVTFVQALGNTGVRSGTLGLDGRTWIDVQHGLERVLPKTKLESAERLLREVRMCKSPAESAALREAQRQGARAFLALRDGLLRPDVSEADLQDELYRRFAPEGLECGPMIQSGPNAAVPHHNSGPRKLQVGDLIVVDSVIRWQAYTSDITRTFALGEPSAKAKKAYRTVRAAQAAAIEAARPGVACRKLDEIARKVIADAGFGEYFIHRLGHGVGIEGHEPPYLAGSETETLRPGVCCTVEPGIYIPGEFGIRIEDEILITRDGCELLRGELPTNITAAFDA